MCPFLKHLLQRFRRTPRPEDLVRMRTFANRVKSVDPKRSYTQPHSALICELTWISLRDAIQGPLLPNVTWLAHSEVTSRPNFDDSVWATDILVGPKLKYATLSVRTTRVDPAPALRIFSELSRGAPDIRRIRISVATKSISDDKPLWLGGEIGGLRHLTSFKAPGLELLPEAVEHLASLPDLASIIIMTKPVGHNTTKFPYTGERTGRFPSLVNVEIHTNCFVWCAAFLRTISSPVLRELLIENRSRPSEAPVLEDLLAAVGQLPGGPALRSLKIFSGNQLAGLPPGPTIVSAAAMLPLAALAALTFVHIEGWCSVLLDDPTLATLARAWPALKYLRLYFPSQAALADSFPVSCPLVTLKGLAVFARACPVLSRVFLPVDARVVPVYEPMLGGRHLQRPAEVPERTPALRYLGVGDSSPIRDAVQVASYLALFFPGLKEVYQSSGPGSLWCQANRMRWKFVRVREQERKARQRR